jgi:hypothetical protein
MYTRGAMCSACSTNSLAIMSAEAAEYIDRPAKLTRVSKGHGMRIIAGLGMEPRYEPGDVIQTVMQFWLDCVRCLLYFSGIRTREEQRHAYDRCGGVVGRSAQSRGR